MLGNVSFWKVAAKNPDAVFQLMIQDTEMWVIDAGDRDVWEGKQKSEYSGPFRLYVPAISTFVKIYGKADRIEAEQQKIMQQVLPSQK